MRTYGQYCPIARGAGIFAERWTALIIRMPVDDLDGADGLGRRLIDAAS